MGIDVQVESLDSISEVNMVNTSSFYPTSGSMFEVLDLNAGVNTLPVCSSGLHYDAVPEALLERRASGFSLRKQPEPNVRRPAGEEDLGP